jgi:hypothetical protein
VASDTANNTKKRDNLAYQHQKISSRNNGGDINLIKPL